MNQSTIYKRRLLKMARFLRELHSTNFHMHVFRNKINVVRANLNPKKRNCGTIACIAGWAPFVFPSYLNINSSVIDVAKIFGIKDIKSSPFYHYYYDHQPVSNLDAAKALEDIARKL